MGTPAPKSTAIAKSLGASLAIQSVSELFQLADILYKGGASNIPGLGRTEAVAHVILAGAEVGFSPTQALSTIMLLDGKTSIYGDGALALVRASGLLDGEVNESVEGDGDDRKGICKLKRKGESEKTFTFSMGEAKRAGLIERAKGKGPWATYPDRMLKMRARSWAMRDLFSDVLRGLTIYEEAHDVDVVNTEVKVISTSTDAPAGQPAQTVATTETPTLTPEQASTTAAPKQLDGPITDAQKKELHRLNGLIMAAKGLSDQTAKKTAWEQILAPYGVASMKDMNAATAQRAIEDLGPQYDPFTYGQKTAQPSTSAA